MTSQPDAFDDLYKDVRDDLLVEAYALTGDLGVSRAAVRDACAVAWHHWNKVRKVDDRVAWLRPHVWKRARVRHSVRPWHKERNLSDDVAATLAALDKLSLNQRKALVLTHLSPVPLTEAAREIGVTLTVVDDLVRSATASFTELRGVDASDVPVVLDSLREAATGRWPRSSIIRRAGTARRRAHTLAGIMGTVALVIGSGAVVASGDNTDAALDKQSFERRPTKVNPIDEVPALTNAYLLEAAQVGRLGSAWTWGVTDTHDNSSGEGLVVPCQAERFADPEAQALVRSFSGTPANGKGETATATEMVQISLDEERASATYATAHDWFAHCSSPRTQLLAYETVTGVGDQAAVFTLRDWRASTRTVQVALARSGQTTTATVAERPGKVTSTSEVVQLLAAAVNAQCGQPGVATCASPPTSTPATVPVAGEKAGMLSEFDLPPVAGTTGPWVGAPPQKATARSVTSCDRAGFAGPDVTGSLTRTFVFPDTKRRGTLGLAQSAAVAKNPAAAKKFATKIKSRVDACRERPGPTIRTVAQRRSPGGAITVWRLDVPVSDSSSVDYLMAVVRRGRVVSQITFVPSGKYQMKTDEFVRLATRTQERLDRFGTEG